MQQITVYMKYGYFINNRRENKIEEFLLAKQES